MIVRKAVYEKDMMLHREQVMDVVEKLSPEPAGSDELITENARIMDGHWP
jgi:hypothetical protein